MRALHRRLARLESVRPDLSSHWDRVHTERAAGFDKFLASVPDTHLERVWEALGSPESVAERLFVAGPTWEGQGAPAVVKFAWVRATWGDDHPYNPPLPDPLPIALLDLYLDHPDAEIHHTSCLNCRAFVPCSPASGRVGEDYVWPRPLTDTCPVCGASLEEML